MRPISGAGHPSPFGIAGVSQQFSQNVHNFMNNHSMYFDIQNEYGVERTRLLENREVGQAAVQHPLLRRPQTSSLATMSQMLASAAPTTTGVSGHPTTAAFAMNELQRAEHMNENEVLNSQNIQAVMHNDVALQRLMVNFIYFKMHYLHF